MAMLTAYLDASFGPDPVYVVGGYIGTLEQWDRFENEWRKMLKDESVSIFNPASLECLQAEFSGWSKERKLNFQIRAYSIIQKHRDIAISAGVVTRDFNNLKIRFANLKPERKGNFYTFCTHEWLKNASNWIRRYRVKGSIWYILEAGDEGRGEVNEVFKMLYDEPTERADLHLEEWSFQNKRCSVQLQAAGTWAYESYKQMVNRHLAGKVRKVRDSYRALYRPEDKLFNTFWDKDNLPELRKLLQTMGATNPERRKGEKSYY